MLNLAGPCNVIGVQKCVEQFVYLYDDDPESYRRLISALGLHAGNPELALSWSNAAVLSKRAREIQKSKEQAN